MKKNNGFKVAALAASIALAMSATSAMAAAPTATQLPGHGKVLVGSTTDGAVVNVTDPSHPTMSIGFSGNLVINWGKGTGEESDLNLNSTGVAGFNIGSDATVTFNGLNVANDAVLNIDSSGNASQIFGTLAANNANVFVANANGVIVGDHAIINGSSGTVGLIANTLSSTAADDFTVGEAVEYAGTGGDVTVQAGANLSAVTLISGGGTVNVDAGALSSTVTLSAGLSSATAGGFATDNDAAKLTVTGDGTVASFSSAGDASSSGALTINAGDVAGTFTNTGTLALADSIELSGTLVNEKTVSTTGSTGGLTLGGLTNDGEFTASSGLAVNGDLINNGKYDSGNVSVTKGDLTNSGTFDVEPVFAIPIGIFPGQVSVSGGNLANKGEMNAGEVSVTDGDFTNDGSIDGAFFIGQGTLLVTNGSIANNGKLTRFTNVTTASDDDFTAGADYSITNAGTMQLSGVVSVNEHEDGGDNDTTGSFTNTGTLQLNPFGAPDMDLQIHAHDDITLGGSVEMYDGDDFAAVSAKNPVSDINLKSADGALTVSTPLAFTGDDSFLMGQQVAVMADVTGGDTSLLVIAGGDKMDDGYAIRIGNGTTVSANTLGVGGVTTDAHPNVILQGTLSGATIGLGGEYDNGDFSGLYSVSDVFSGPNGGLVATGDDPIVGIFFTGAIKTAKYLNDSNFRYNYLPITVADADAVNLSLNPVAFDTIGTADGSAVNILVNGSVNLSQGVTGDAPVSGNGSAVTGVTNTPNTHLVLQSTGNIGTDGNFYWPGYVYLGTIAANDDGSAAPGTLGLGMISLGGDFNNVLPGDVSGASGVHFITQFPLSIAGDVVTNANAWVNFGTDLLTQGYATGTLGGSFYGGTQAAGTVVNYGELDASMFHTHAPVATK